MSTVYITNASLKQISKSLRLKGATISREKMTESISSDFGVDDVVTADILNDIFNNFDLKDMYFMKMVLKDFAMLLDEIQGNKQVIKEYIDNSNRKYVTKVKAPSYHKDNTCQWMSKSFFNIEIPLECLDNKEIEQKVKVWLEKNKHLEFCKLNEEFKIQFNCPKGLSKVARENSGSAFFNNQNIEIEFNSKVKSKYRQLRFFLNGEFAEKVANTKYAPNFKIISYLEKDSDTKSHKTILDFHSVKETLKNIIFDFYKVKYNNELKFEATILDQIGFNTCKGCG